MADQVPTAYERLGVSPRASSSEITSAYRRLLRRHHPDSRDAARGHDDDPVGDEAAASALGSIIEAYAVLRDPVRRADYDRGQEGPWPTTARYRTPANHDFLLRAGPVRWTEPTSTREFGRPTVTQPEVPVVLLKVLGVWF